MADNAAPKANLSVSLDINTNGNYGPSDALLVYEALVAHRNTHLDLCFEDLQTGHYKNAYGYYRSYDDLDNVINHFVQGLIKLASHNYEASETKGCSAATVAARAQKHKDLRDSAYRHWKDKYVGSLDPDSDRALATHETGLSILNELRGRGVSESSLRSIAVMYGVENVPHIAEIIEGTDEPKKRPSATGPSLNDLIGKYTKEDFTGDKHDPNDPNQELAALCHDLKNKDDLETIDLLARQGYTLRQLSDVAYRLND